MKFLTLVTPDLGTSLLKMKFLILVTSDLGTSLVKMKFLPWAYVVGGGWRSGLAAWAILHTVPVRAHIGEGVGL